ncbi:aminotransferase class V-fold PLP-dependent enzyme [Roseivivax isoporae]|uniref:NifS n=1 Tax=Roseivivax isoporae LMG 25204 TaxID=1449351 RepID=X7F3U0_9RHOB|nr:aminotransferase class V-fold PLP-dependent enzyme [Roseivivax isoporae]ETX26771.1 NifS [Roseivivax isoporae LMG 25204]
MQLDIDWVRAQFPAFASEALAGQLHFENAGGSYACRPVIDRLTRFYTERKVQPYGAADPSRLAGEEMDEARTRLAALMGVARDEVSFGPSTTQNTYVLAQAFREHLSDGDAIVVTEQDHEANSGPWRRLADAGIEVREWRIDPATGHLDREALAALLGDGRVRLVCFPHCSNVVAEINPVAEIVAQVHAADAVACVDGVSYAPHGLPDVAALGADIYLFSAYKTYGPHQGIMVIRRALGEALPNQAHFFNAGSLYKRFTPAGPDHAQIAASAGIADYLEAMADRHGIAPADTHDLMRAHEIRLLQPLLDAVTGRNGVRLLGPADGATRAPTVALDVPDPQGAARALAARGINAGASDFYAVRPLKAMGIDPARGVLRLSFVHYTSEDEVRTLVSALEDAI